MIYLVTALFMDTVTAVTVIAMTIGMAHSVMFCNAVHPIVVETATVRAMGVTVLLDGME